MPLKKNYKVITLPDSKEKITIRKLNAYDYAHIGTIPDTIKELEEKVKKEKITGKKAEEVKSIEELSPQDIDYISRCVCRAIVRTPANKLKIVSKHPEDCRENEFSFYDLSTADSIELMGAVYNPAGEGGEGDVPLTFPKKQS